MNINVKIKLGNKCWKVSILSLLGFLYFCRPAFLTLAGSFQLDTRVISAAIFFVWLGLFLLYSLQSFKNISIDGIIIIAFVFLFFGLTIIIHPEYQWIYNNEYNKGQFSSNAVFRVGAGIYAYYHIRLFKNREKELFKLFSVVPYIILVSNICAFFSNKVTSYDMNFGYQMELAAILFIGQFLYEKDKISSLLFSVIAIVFAVLGGSRGCVIGYFIFVIAFFIWQQRFTIRKLIIISMGILLGIIIQSKTFLLSMYYFFSSYGYQPRILQFLAIKGEVFVDEPRNKLIWPSLISELKRMTLFKMYGAYGSRQFVPGNYTFAHNFILEILLDFGKFFGGLILIWIIFKFVKICHDNKTSSALLIIAFGSFSLCRLFFSSSFWYEPYFWAFIAMLVNCSKSVAKTSLKYQLRIKQET